MQIVRSLGEEGRYVTRGALSRAVFSRSNAALSYDPTGAFGAGIET